MSLQGMAASQLTEQLLPISAISSSSPVIRHYFGTDNFKREMKKSNKKESDDCSFNKPQTDGAGTLV